MSIKKNIFAPSTTGRGAMRRAAMLLLVMMLTATTAWATTTSTITVGSTDYTLFTGFTATSGNGTNYAKLVDGNTSTDWVATKNYGDPNAPAGDFNGGTEDPAFVEFHADEAFIPKGYVLTCDNENAGFWKPVSWALKAKLNESDEWTTIQSSTTTLGEGKTFEIACNNDGDNEYQYFRFEVYEVGTTMKVDLDELQFYGSLPAYTHLTVKAATCMATGIKQDCYRRNSDGKYFTDNTGTTELAESDVIAPIIPHTGVHHDATDTHIKYWQCSMCGKYFSDEGCTTEITEEQTKIYRTITIDNSISGLVEVAFSKTQALAGESIILYVDYQVDASTLKVNDGAVELTAKTDIQYTFTMPAADVTVTADVAQSNADGDILTGSIRHTVTIPNGASITLNNATITGGIVCNGTATITLVGTNSVSGATNKAGIQVGGSGTTLTIRGDGSLTVTGGDQSAGIGLSRAWNVTEDVVGGNIVINGGNITANGGGGGAGIGAGVTKDPNNSSSRKAIVGTITIAGGSVTAVGGSNADGIGAGENNYNATIQIGTVTIYDGIDMVDASSIKDFASVVYMHGETDVTANKTDYFAIGEDGNRRLIVQKPVIADIPDQTYTGSAITPEPLVIAGSLSLTKGTDYVYSYTNNTNVGTAKVRATFQGNYSSLGYVEKTFNIVYPTVTPSQDGHGNYLIGTAAELYGFAQLVNNGNATANAKLTADIVVNENVLDANGEANTGDFVQWTPIGNNFFEDKVYSGTFDGQGHTISGLYVSGNGWFVGFVGQVSGTAVVKNLGIVDSYFSSSNDNLGSIVGGVAEKSSVTIANVYSTSTVNGDNWIGGLVGGDGTGSLTIINSYFAGKTITSYSYGTHHDDLVAGDFDRSTLTVCNAFVLGTSQYGTSVTAEQLSDGTVAAALHYYQDALADGSMFGLSGGKTNFSGTIDGVSVTTANITLHTFDGDATAYSSKYIVGNTTPLPVNVEREGYTFFGWYDNADLEGDAVTSISSSETGNKEYWAKFERSHAVSFVLGGGTIRSGEIDHYIEGETTVLPTYVTKVGASFEGWYTTEDFTGSRYYSIPSTATEDMTFYAKWGEEKTTFYLRQGPETVNILYEGENLVWLDETTTERYVISDNFYNYWGPIPGINVPYTGGASTFDHNISEISVAQSGFYVFTLTDKGEGNWFVSVLKSMLNCDVASIPTQVYTGSAIEPAVTVKDGETPLTLGTDYEVAYSNNVNAGTATVTITGMGNYSDSREATFNITPFLADQFGAVFVYQDQNGKTALLDGTWEDGVDIPSIMNITVNHVTSNRMFTPGKASTVMLPFNYTCSGEEGGTFYKFVGVEKENNVWVATMQETGNDANNEGTLIANTPYLFMPTASTMTFPNIPNEGVVFCTEGGGNCETADPGSHWTFKGTYRYMHWKNDPEDVYYYYRSQEIGHIYGFAGVSKNDINVGDFVKVAWGAKIRPMRAYLLWNNEPNSANARSFTRGAAATDEELPQSITVRLVGSNGETTGIGTLDTETGEMTFDSEAWYTLDGVRLSGKPTKKGLYINNGKKIVIR